MFLISNNVTLLQGCSAKKKVWERSQKLVLLKQLQTHFKAKHEKGVGTPFARVPAPLPTTPLHFYHLTSYRSHDT